MIKFTNLNQETPYLSFKKKYDDALNANQKNIEAICFSSYSKKLKEVNARFVNLKFIADKNFIFFSNYNSQKSQDFKEHNQISALVYWNSTNTQIRMKATIERSPKEFNESYFSKRSEQKNALSISSNQSEFIDSYENVKEKYLKYKKKYLCEKEKRNSLIYNINQSLLKDGKNRRDSSMFHKTTEEIKKRVSTEKLDIKDLISNPTEASVACPPPEAQGKPANSNLTSQIADILFHFG